MASKVSDAMAEELNEVIERVIKGEYDHDELGELLDKLSCSDDRRTEIIDLTDELAEQIENLCQGGNTDFSFTALGDIVERREELRSTLTLEFGTRAWL